MEDVAAEFGDTPGFFQLYTPKDRDLAASLVARAKAAGFKGIVVTLDTWLPGWRPRDLATSNFPFLRGLCLANYTSDPVFRASLARTPEEDPQGRGAAVDSDLRESVDVGRPAVAAVAHRPAVARQGHLSPRRCASRPRRRGRRHLLLQPRRPPGQRRRARDRLPARRGGGRRGPSGAVRLGHPQRGRHRQGHSAGRVPRSSSAGRMSTGLLSAVSTASCMSCAPCSPRPTSRWPSTATGR